MSMKQMNIKLLAAMAAPALVFASLTAWMATKIPTLATDSYRYIWQARHFVDAPVLDWPLAALAFSKPFHSILLAFFHYGFEDIETAGIALSIFSGFIAVVFCGLISLRLFNSHKHGKTHILIFSMIAPWLLALHPFFIDYSARILTEALFSALSLAGIFFLDKMLQSEKYRYAVISGIVLGFGLLTREIGIVFIPLALLSPFLKTMTWLKKATMLGLLMAVISVFYLPGYLSGARTNIARENLFADLERPLERDKAFFSLDETGRHFQADIPRKDSMLDFIIENPGFFPRRMGGNIVPLGEIMVYVMGGFFVLTAAIGLISWIITIKSAGHTVYLIIAFAALNTIAIIPVNLEYRYVVPWISFFVLPAAQGVVFISEMLKRVKIPIYLSSAIIVAIFLYSYYGKFTHEVGRELDPQNNLIDEKEAGQWLHGKIPAGSIIMARKPDIPYYTGGEYVFIPFTDVPNLHKFACHRGVDFIVLSERFVFLRPEIGPLYNAQKKHEGFLFKGNFIASNGIRFWIYRIICPSKNSPGSPKDIPPPNLHKRFGR